MQLLRNDRNGGWEQVGVGTQSVAVKDEKTTPFVFSYTFTQDDLAIGKVTFQMVATIVGARDAIPGDNTVVSLPVVVTTVAGASPASTAGARLSRAPRSRRTSRGGGPARRGRGRARRRAH